MSFEAYFFTFIQTGTQNLQIMKFTESAESPIINVGDVIMIQVDKLQLW